MFRPQTSTILLGLSTLVAVLLSLTTRPASVSALANGYFKEVALQRGLDQISSAGRVVFTDLNRDGWPDLVLNNQIYMQNQASPNQTRTFAAINLEFMNNPCSDGKPASLLIFADVDNDGDEDVYAARFQEIKKPGAKKPFATNQLWLNNGDLQFQNAKNSGLEAFQDPIIAATFLDVNHDGLLDLITASSYEVYGQSLKAAPTRILVRANSKSTTFVDKTGEFGMNLRPEPGFKDSRKPIYGITHGDFNNDGQADILMCAYGRQWNELWIQQADTTFKPIGQASNIAGDKIDHGKYPQWLKKAWKKRFKTDRKDEEKFRANGNTFDAAIADFDNDGDMDVFLSEITHAWAGDSSDLSCLLINQLSQSPENKSTVRFVRAEKLIPRRRSGRRWNQGDMHAAWLDFDNDGYLDLLIASADYPDGQFLRLFQQSPPGQFKDVSLAAGLNWEGASQFSLADYDRDGDVDILVSKSMNRLPKQLKIGRSKRFALFENTIGQLKNSVTIKLIGQTTNRDAIGARATLKTAASKQLREVQSSQGHAGHSGPRELYFGLNTANKIDTLTIQWPGKNKIQQVFKALPVNCVITITENSSKPKIQSYSEIQ